METYIPISELNDFVFCPKSIYYHHIYARYKQSLYHREEQTEGRLNHTTIDRATYSTKKKWLQGVPVYCGYLGIAGKIDLFDRETGILIERKTRIKKLYRGYVYQLQAQYYCLRSMGYEIRKMQFHSLADNKTYPVSLPTPSDKAKLQEIVWNMRHPDPFSMRIQNPKKCAQCIYAGLCDIALNPVGDFYGGYP